MRGNKVKAVSVRLDPTIRKRLDKVSEHLRLDKTALIRMAVESMLHEVETKNWKISRVER